MTKKPKRTYKKRKAKKNLFTFSNILLIINIILFVIVSFLYLENKNLKEQTKIYKTKIEQLKKEKKELSSRKKKADLKHLFEEKTKALEIEYTKHIDTAHYIKKQSKHTEPKFNYKDDIKKDIAKSITKPIQSTKDTKPKVYKPKLAIIIDDISNQHQVNKILAIPYNVNASFLPPNKSRKYSAIVAHKLKHYMIHLPLQASNNRYDEKKTLHINDSIKKIEARIIEVKELYPRATFINNHTGSKFTSDIDAMSRLYEVLKKYNYTFVDSRTTSHSVANFVAKKYGVRTLSRNIFLDNKKDKQYILHQLKKAIRIAKKNGSAIAIGHPYNITLDTLKGASSLLKDIDVVYVENL